MTELSKLSIIKFLHLLNADTHISTFTYISSNKMLNIMAIPQNIAKTTNAVVVFWTPVCHQLHKTFKDLSPTKQTKHLIYTFATHHIVKTPQDTSTAVLISTVQPKWTM